MSLGRYDDRGAIRTRYCCCDRRRRRRRYERWCSEVAVKLFVWCFGPWYHRCFVFVCWLVTAMKIILSSVFSSSSLLTSNLTILIHIAQTLTPVSRRMNELFLSVVPANTGLWSRGYWVSFSTRLTELLTGQWHWVFVPRQFGHNCLFFPPICLNAKSLCIPYITQV
jgi:hypothetical protein